MSFTFTTGVATFMAAGAALLQMLQPETWTPFYRAQLANKRGRNRTWVGLVIGGFGQAVTTAAVGLLVTILVLSVVAVADERTHLWTGVAVVVLSLVYFLRHWRRPDRSWASAAELIRALNSGSAEAKDPYGKLDQTPGEITRTMIFSPSFILAPMFVAAAGSGHTAVANALPVIIAYALFSIVGLLWLVRLIGNGTTGDPLEYLVTRSNLIVGVAVIVLGLVTAVVG